MTAGKPRKKISGDGQVVVPNKARLSDATELANRLRDLPIDSELSIDATAAEDVSTPYLLTLVAAVRSREAATPPAIVVSPTDAFVDAFSDLGLFQDLMKMEFRA